MTHEEIKGWVDANIERKMREFGVPHWRITVEYFRLDDNTSAKVDLNDQAYERALITIDTDSFKNDVGPDVRDGIENAIEHELLHVAHSPFELIRKMLHDGISDTQLYNSMVVIFNQACEMTVRNLERTIHGVRQEMGHQVLAQEKAKELIPVATSGYIQIADIPHSPTNGHAKPELAPVALNG